MINTPQRTGTTGENKMIKIRYKVPNGKLLKIKLTKEEQTIKDMSINGDFFIYPEESIKHIEKAIEGIRINEVEQKAKEVIEKENIKLTGFTPRDLEKAIASATA